MWDEIWKWMTDRYIYNALVVLGVIVLIFSPRRLGGLFGKLKKIKAGVGGIELEAQDHSIDPNTPCPYTKSQNIVFAAIREINGKFDKLANEVNENYRILKNVYVDQQKQMFYDRDQPSVERLAGGLNYVSNGGNGDTRPKIEAFAEEHPEIYKALTLKKPELRLRHEQ
jgi:hypothetical protein